MSPHHPTSSVPPTQDLDRPCGQLAEAGEGRELRRWWQSPAAPPASISALAPAGPQANGPNLLPGRPARAPRPPPERSQRCGEESQAGLCGACGRGLPGGRGRGSPALRPELTPTAPSRARGRRTPVHRAPSGGTDLLAAWAAPLLVLAKWGAPPSSSRRKPPTPSFLSDPQPLPPGSYPHPRLPLPAPLPSSGFRARSAGQPGWKCWFGSAVLSGPGAPGCPRPSPAGRPQGWTGWAARTTLALPASPQPHLLCGLRMADLAAPGPSERKARAWPPHRKKVISMHHPFFYSTSNTGRVTFCSAAGFLNNCIRSSRWGTAG